eukprot:jgi/Botrbrau1/14208/Bobra.0291s0013.1
MVHVTGVLLAVFSAICNGTYGVLAKVRSVIEAEVATPVFNFWVAVGVFVSTLPLLLLTARVFTPWGLLSGLLFVLSTANAFFAISKMGLSSASGIWCGTAVVVSFTFGVRIMGDQITRPALAAPGLVLLIAGLAGIALNHQIVDARRRQQASGFDLSGRLEEDVPLDSHGLAVQPGRSSYFIGVAAAVGAGALGGLILAPMNWAPAEAKGLPFIPSMALGVLLAAPFVTAGTLLASGTSFGLAADVAAGPGMLSGAIWNLGNICSVVAVQDPGVGLAIAYPIMQCGLFVAGLWGIFLHHELKGREQAGYWFGGVVLIIGATLLASSK